MPVIKSSTPVLDASGNPAVGRIVRAYREDNGALLGEAVVSSGSSTAYRYWRIYTTSTQDSTYTAIQEMEYRIIAGGADFTTPTMVANASSYFDGQYPAAAFDNDFYTLGTGCWVSSGMEQPQWLSIDLGAGVSADFAEVAIWTQSRSDLVGRGPRDFSIQGSLDGTNWEVIKSFTNVTGWQAGVAKTFDISRVVLPLGYYEIQTSYTGPVFVVCLDDAAGTIYNHQILRTTPV